MKTGQGADRDAGGAGGLDQVTRVLVEERNRGLAPLDRQVNPNDPNGSVALLAMTAKQDLRARFARGERPKALTYIENHPRIKDDPDRVLSLIYEEYCLLEERGDRPDTLVFCDRYDPWRDSIASQLRYHRVLSQFAGAPPSRPRFPERGETFDSFFLVDVLGHGGSARVYLAKQTELGHRDVVLKVSADSGQEPAILGRLTHPNIVPVLTLVRDPLRNLRGLVMPYRPGLPLDEVIKKLNLAPRPNRARAIFQVLGSSGAIHRKAWPDFPARGTYADGVAWIMEKLADALSHAHHHQVLHLDVKPANVLLTPGHGPQLLDFNLAHAPHDPEEAAAAVRGGTLPYMAPEQLAAFLDPERWGRVGPAADLYSLGLLGLELLTGQPPLAHNQELPLARSIQDLLDRRRDSGASALAGQAEVPRALRGIIARCLALDPARRPASAAALASSLRRYVTWRKWSRRLTKKAFVMACSLSCVLAAPSLVPAKRGPEGGAASAPAALNLNPKLLESAARLHHERKYAEVLTLLKNQGDSPLTRFYEAAATAHDGRAANSLGTLNRLLSTPDELSTLAAWAHDHPQFLEHAEALAALLPPSQGMAAPEAAQRGNLAVRLSQWILRLDPSRDRARVALAVTDEGRGRYREAADRLGEVLDLSSAENEPVNPRKTWVVHQIRARVRIKWSQDLLNPKGNEARDATSAMNEAKAAITDLDDPSQNQTELKPEERLDALCLRVEAWLAKGDAALALGDHVGALGDYHEGRMALDTISAEAFKPQGSRSGYLNSLLERTKTRLISIRTD